jgi:2-dehydro-3-deoxyphosphogluconate aldolase / (4S)-4-hydroxy-2-oxoglutarate aldolase
MEFPYLPGVATATEAMGAAEAGFDVLKFFPAQAAGGVPMLKGLADPLPQLGFCPTGGVSTRQSRRLAQAPQRHMRRRNLDRHPPGSSTSADWHGITTRAAAALAVAQRVRQSGM